MGDVTLFKTYCDTDQLSVNGCLNSIARFSKPRAPARDATLMEECALKGRGETGEALEDT